MGGGEARVDAAAAERTHVERLLLTVLVVVPLLLAWWIHFEVGGERVTVVVDDAVELVAPVIAAVACLRAAARVPQAGRAWMSLAAACIAWAFGQAVWTYYEAIQQAEVPAPGAADAGFLIFIPF